MPTGHRLKSFRSRPLSRSAETLVAAAICSIEIPFWMRMRRRLGPKACRLIVSRRGPPQEAFQVFLTIAVADHDSGDRSRAAFLQTITILTPPPWQVRACP